MADESIPLPAACIEPAAKIMAKRFNGFAVPPFVIGALFLYGFVSYHVKRGMPHGVGGAIFGFLIGVVAPSSFGLWLVLRGRRIARTGRVASSDPTLSWHLSGNLIVASDDRNAPRPDLAFAVTSKVRRSLTAAPRATARS